MIKNVNGLKCLLCIILGTMIVGVRVMAMDQNQYIDYTSVNENLNDTNKFNKESNEIDGNSQSVTLWVDSLMSKMTLEQKIAQLMVVRVPSNMDHREQRNFERLIKDIEVGGVCFFAGTAKKQVEQTKRFQSISKIPLLVCIDGEWGLGMRLKDCYSFPKQMLMGALTPEYDSLIYEVGTQIGKQCKKMGIHINFAPVVDLNSNPKNPVIGVRSFGENPMRVSHKGIMYMKGMQDQGVIAVAKHFPGHGDTEVDSHEDLPVITHTKDYIDSVDLYPFRAMIDAGVGGVMTGHLHIKTLDDTPHMPASLSSKIVNGVLRNELGFSGLIITDGLDMRGVTKYFKHGNGELQALLAGNDILLLSPDVKKGITTIAHEAKKNDFVKQLIDMHCRKVLRAKFNCGLDRLNVDSIVAPNIEDKMYCDSLSYEIALRGITLLNGKNWEVGMNIPVYYCSPYKIGIEDAKHGPIVLGYQNSAIVRMAVDSLISGKYPFRGCMPVTAAGYCEGTGIEVEVEEKKLSPYRFLPEVGMDSNKFYQIDEIIERGLNAHAYPGCRLLVAKDGKVVYNRAYGTMTYDSNAVKVELNTMYDLASLTKVTATTLAIMKLVDDGKIALDDEMSKYLPYLKHSNKRHLTIKQALSHFGRLKAYDVYWKEGQFATNPREYVLDKIVDSKLLPKRRYVYSDFGFILLADMVKYVSGKDIDVYMIENFYKPMGLSHITYRPLECSRSLDSIAPTENDTIWRHRLVHGTVHDQNAVLMGGVSGHAGLFASADDVYALCQMLLDDGMYQGKRYLSVNVIDMFNTRYYVDYGNRRALGFDKPFISDVSTHVAAEASQKSFGHTGFTGTMLWVDPEYNLVYIFLSNRVCPNVTPNRLSQMNIRTDIQSLIYKSIK